MTCLQNDLYIDELTRLMEVSEIFKAVSPRVVLTQVGNYYAGHCPFCMDDGLAIAPARNRFYCWGCLRQGNDIDFAMEINKLRGHLTGTFRDHAFLEFLRTKAQ